MVEEKKITILNMSLETRKAAEQLMKKDGSPFTSVEDCIASLMAYRMQLKASNCMDEARRLDEEYHLEGIKVIYSVEKEKDGTE